MPDDRDDWVFQNHPDLVDPRWAKKAAKAARRARRSADRQGVTRLRRRRTGRLRGGSIVIVALVIMGGFVIAAHPWTMGAQPVLPDSATLAETATTRVGKPLNLAEPFANTPAAGWPDGEAGIQPPAAAPVGGYSAAQVGAAYQHVRQILIAGHLDPRMLYDHDTSTYLSLFAAYPRPDLRKTLADPATPDDGGGITLLAKGFQLLPVPIKVTGSMSAGIGEHGSLVVHTNYVFAFPFAPKDPNAITASWQIVAIQHVAKDFDDDVDSRVPAADQGIYEGGGHAYYDQMACSPSKRGLLAPAYSEPRMIGPPDTENPDAYYDPNHGFTVPSCPG